MAKEPTVISIDDLARRVQSIRVMYGAGAEVTVDEDLNIEPYNRPDVSEETPEESAKRAQRQTNETLDRAEDQAEAPRLTRPVEAIRAEVKEATKAAAPKAEASRTER